VAVPSDRNVTEKEARKKLKYKKLSAETERMWNMKRSVIPVNTGATGIVTKGLNIQQILYRSQLNWGHRT
jgi:hypothetical protein